MTELGIAHSDIEQGNIKDILAVHLRFLRDRILRKRITELIQAESLTAEYAFSTVL